MAGLFDVLHDAAEMTTAPGGGRAIVASTSNSKRVLQELVRPRTGCSGEASDRVGSCSESRVV